MFKYISERPMVALVALTTSASLHATTLFALPPRPTEVLAPVPMPPTGSEASDGETLEAVVRGKRAARFQRSPPAKRL